MENTTDITPPQTAGAPGSALVTAAQQMDWTQVVLNHQYGPPCFCLGKDGRFCGRAQTWAGHPSSHLYTPLADLISLLEERGNTALDTLIALSVKPAEQDLLDAAKEMEAAMRSYQMDADDEPPYRHRATMERARAAIAKAEKQNNPVQGP